MTERRKNAASGNAHGSDHAVVFFIDKEKFDSDTAWLTPREILTDYAHEDPATTTLVQKQGQETDKLTDLDREFEVKNGTKFTVLHNGPTPVS